jgi:ribose transport system substrate-binding protein
MQWEPVHTGAEAATDRTGESIYWNAPTREDDVEAQIALVDRVVSRGYQGLVLAPDQGLALITPVRRALAHGIPTVVIGSPLPIPPSGNLSYILNDESEGGRLGAERVGKLLNGHGTIAILGVNPDVSGIMVRLRALERFVADHYPGIRIVDTRMGSFNVPHEQQVAEDTLRSNPKLDAIVSLMSTSTDGVLAALGATPGNASIKVIGYDSADSSGYAPFDQKPALDCVIQMDTRSMGEEAVKLIHARLLRQPAPTMVQLQPKLLTRENINTPEVRRMLSMDFKLGNWHWSTAQ